MINRYFYPDESATSQLASSLAAALSASGWETHAVTSRQYYTVTPFQRGCADQDSNVRVHRVWTTKFGRGHLLGRAIDYLTFYLSALLRIVLCARRGDVIITLTDPPLMSVLSSFGARLRNCNHINWLQDVFPEVACRLGVVSPSIWTRLMIWQRNRSLRSATMNVVIGELMQSFLQQQHVNRSSITVIHNWSDGSNITPYPPHENPLRQDWGLDGKFVVGYSGNLGRAHDFRTALEAALTLRDDPSVHFLFIGGGHLLELLRTEAQKLSLSNISIRPYQPASELRDSLTLPDVHLISLQPSVEGLIVPSKFYGIAAAGRPTIFIGDPQGEIPNLLKRFDCGTCIEIGDGIALARSIKALQGDTQRRDSWGRNARALFIARFDRPHAIRQWMHVLENSMTREPPSQCGPLLPTLRTVLEQPAAILSRRDGADSNAAAVLFIGGCLSCWDTPSLTAALRSAIRNKHTDWVRIIGFANFNAVTPALWIGLNRRDLTSCLPDDVRSYLAIVYDLNRERNQIILRQALEAVAALNHCGIQPVFMKGCLTLLEGSLDIGSSMMTDIDIVVEEDKIPEASRALRTLGYVTLGEPAPHAHAWTFHRAMSLVTIDLHRHVGPQRSILPADIAIREAVAQSSDALKFRGLSITHRVLLLIMSFGIFERHYHARDIPLRNLHYLASLCHRHADEIDWPMIAKTMAAHRLTAETAAWCLLARCFLDVPVPSDLYRGIRAHDHLMCSLRQLARPRLGIAARTYGTVAWSLNRFRMDYRYGCGTDGLGLYAARIRHVFGILVREGSELIQDRVVKPGTARPAGSREGPQS